MGIRAATMAATAAIRATVIAGFFFWGVGRIGAVRLGSRKNRIFRPYVRAHANLCCFKKPEHINAIAGGS